MRLMMGGFYLWWTRGKLVGYGCLLVVEMKKKFDDVVFQKTERKGEGFMDSVGCCLEGKEREEGDFCWLCGWLRGVWS